MNIMKIISFSPFVCIKWNYEATCVLCGVGPTFQLKLRPQGIHCEHCLKNYTWRKQSEVYTLSFYYFYIYWLNVLFGFDHPQDVCLVNAFCPICLLILTHYKIFYIVFLKIAKSIIAKIPCIDYHYNIITNCTTL